MADGFTRLPTRPHLHLIVAEQASVGVHEFPQAEPREPAPAFTVDRRQGFVRWDLNGLRLVHPPQFQVLADIFAENGWKRHFNALLEAELALSAPDPAA